MQQYFLVTVSQLEPLPPKPVLNDYNYVRLHSKGFERLKVENIRRGKCFIKKL